MLYTKNFNLSKPEKNDLVDIDILSANFEVLDTIIKENQTSNEGTIHTLTNENLLIDGGFQIWLEHDSISFPASTTLSYASTIWATSTASLCSTTTINKVDEGLKISGSYILPKIYQVQENFYFNGNNLTLSFTAETNFDKSFSNQCSILVYQNGYLVNLLFAPTITISANETTNITVSFDCSKISGYYDVHIFLLSSSTYVNGYAILSNAKLEYGDNATLFVPESYSVSLLKVSPYYEQSWSGEWSAGTSKFEDREIGALSLPHKVEFSATKRIVPSFLYLSPSTKDEGIVDNFHSTNVGGTTPSVSYLTQKGFEISKLISMYPDYGYGFHWKADARIY